MAGDERPCPFCAEMIKSAAVKCKHCGEFLEPEARAVELAPDERACPSCGGAIKAAASKCKHCGTFLTDNGPRERSASATTAQAGRPPWYRDVRVQVGAGVIAAVVVAVLLLGGGGDSDAPTQPAGAGAEGGSAAGTETLKGTVNRHQAVGDFDCGAKDGRVGPGAKVDVVTDTAEKLGSATLKSADLLVAPDEHVCAYKFKIPNIERVDNYVIGIDLVGDPGNVGGPAYRFTASELDDEDWNVALNGELTP